MLSGPRAARTDPALGTLARETGQIGLLEFAFGDVPLGIVTVLLEPFLNHDLETPEHIGFFQRILPRRARRRGRASFLFRQIADGMLGKRAPAMTALRAGPDGRVV